MFRKTVDYEGGEDHDTDAVSLQVQAPSAADPATPFETAAAGPGSAPAAGSTLDSIAPDLRSLAVPLLELVPASNNARRHSFDRDIPALMESLQRFGQRKAIVAKRTYRGSRNAVIAGSGTLLAAGRLGWSHLAVSWFEGTDDEARAYAVADNAVAELSEWDIPQLARDLDADTGLLAFFDPANLADLLGAAAPVPDFQPVSVDDQPTLDALNPIVCPECGHAFRP